MAVAAVIVFAVLLLLLFRSVFKKSAPRDPSGRGKAGESKVSSILRSLPEEYLVLDDVTIPDQGSTPDRKYTTQIDHVVVSPYGVFVIETKNYSGWIFGDEKSRRWKQTFKTTEAHFLYNPVKQNWGHTYALAERLLLDINMFKPIVVFSDDCELHTNTTTPVVNMSRLRALILSCTQAIIPRENVAVIYDRLSRLDLNGEEIADRHIRSIGERHADRETTLREGRCPRCGGNLVLRNGKYGEFYGCSNYPKCRFTQKK